MNKFCVMNLHSLSLAIAIVFLCLSKSESAPKSNDTHALTQFRLQADTHGYLLTNWTNADACASAWRGVECSPNGRVISLSIPSLNLRGPIVSLSTLTYLRLLDLHDNRLNGTIAPLSNCTDLELLYLAGNDFSGEIPPEISSLRLLIRFDISDNNIHGTIPKEVSKLTHLLTLRLQNNELSGEVPDLSSSLTNLKELNITNNELHGRLPDSMIEKFGNASFSGNDGLCGSSPLPNCSVTEPPSSSDDGSEPVPSNPSSIPKTSGIVTDPPSRSQKRKGLSPGGIVAVVVAVSVVLMVVISFAVAHCCGRGTRSKSTVTMGSSDSGKRKSESSSNGSEKKSNANNNNNNNNNVDSDGTTTTTEAERNSKLVFFDRRSEFELEDLLKASAEMLGKGSLGTVYRAVLDDGCTVAVKRLKDTNPCDRQQFEQYMDVVGKIRHPNVARLRAYYYAKEEKLLVYDYLSNGSLHALLHG